MISFKQFIEDGGMCEALSLSQRKARSMMMKRKAPMMAKKRARTLKKMAPPKKIMDRAMKKARLIIKNKVSAGRYADGGGDLSPAQKQEIEKKVDKKKNVIKKIAKKLFPLLKNKERERVKQMRAQK